jgi:DNA-binding MarR family transcriptional regulator
MSDPKEAKGKDQFARLMAQIEALRSRAAQEFTKALPSEKRRQIVDALRDALAKLTARKS